MKPPEGSAYFIQIDFKKESERPARVFEAMSNIIKAFEQLDKDLIRTIDSKIEPVVLLEDIETGSLRAWLANIIRGIPDEALKELDWKKVVGHYLTKAKYVILKRLEGRTTITDARVIEDIQYELAEEAKKTEIKSFPQYSPIQLPKLVKNIENIQASLEPLGPEDKVTYKSEAGMATFNLELKLNAEELEELITKEKIESISTMILRIKRPDYLGSSMWDLKHGNSLIQAKILHNQWLKDFQSRKIDIRPGDSVRAKVRTTVRYGHDFELIGNSYEILEVIEVIPAPANQQGQMDF